MLFLTKIIIQGFKIHLLKWNAIIFCGNRSHYGWPIGNVLINHRSFWERVVLGFGVFFFGGLVFLGFFVVASEELHFSMPLNYLFSGICPWLAGEWSNYFLFTMSHIEVVLFWNLKPDGVFIWWLYELYWLSVPFYIHTKRNNLNSFQSYSLHSELGQFIWRAGIMLWTKCKA